MSKMDYPDLDAKSWARKTPKGATVARDVLQAIQRFIHEMNEACHDHDAVVSVEINARVWNDLESSIKDSPSYQNMFFVTGGSDLRGREFELMGVKFVSYDRVTGKQRV